MEPSSLLALFAAAVAVLAAIVAARAARQATGELPRPSGIAGVAPGFSGRILEGHTRRGLGDDTRDYAFVLSVSNPGIAPLEIVDVTLRVTYRTRANFLGAVDLSSDLRFTVPPRRTVTHTAKYTTSNVIPRHCRIDAYALLLTGESGERVIVDASLPAVLKADTDGTGPATWGWD